MRSIQRSSSSRLVLGLAASSSPNPSQPTPTPNPSQPTPYPDLSMRFSLVSHRSSNLSPELRIQYEQVFFKDIPQNLHFRPLSHLTDETKQGVMLGWDLSFLTFVRKLQNSADPSIFLAELKTYTDQLSEFKNMGYTVSKLRERLIVLETRASRDKLLKDAIHELEKEEKEKVRKAECLESSIKELEEQVRRARNSLALQKSYIEETNMKKMRFIEDAAKNQKEFKKSAHAPL
ncbi:DUF724 domain-containing protein 5-like [Papaver somniferum]|uniref:DUF724 domain-containing protein 5-like n=1 Tax=Papaver somniferum TaxID=3469 RepID=UPI000E6F4E71|nr:DUF724 domain-containing protein 5-like [Papaver somniferum]